MSDIERVNDSRWADPPEDAGEKYCDCDHSEFQHDQTVILHHEEHGDVVMAACGVKGCKCMNFREREYVD